MVTLWLMVKDTKLNIKISANDRYVEVTGINESTSLDYAAGIVFDLWDAMSSEKEEKEELNKISAGGYTSMEKGPRPFGFAHIGSGERLEVR